MVCVSSGFMQFAPQELVCRDRETGKVPRKRSRGLHGRCVVSTLPSPRLHYDVGYTGRKVSNTGLPWWKEQGHADISKQVKSANSRDKGVQTFLKGVKTVIKGTMSTNVKRTQTMAKHNIALTSTWSQYNIDECSYQPPKFPSAPPELPRSSTPLKDGPHNVQFHSPSLNSTLTAIATDDINLDPDYLPEESHISDDADPELDRKSPRDMRKFLVFEDNLLSLFQVCPTCHGSTTASIATVTGTYATVKQECSCGYVRKWESQPMIGTMPAGNVLLSASILYAGCNVAKVFRMFHFFNLVSMCLDTFWRHQKNILWPAIDSVWKTYSRGLFSIIRQRGGLVTVSGDGRADSVGHCAKYGTYSMVDMESGKVISLHLVQSNEVKSSYHMELEGLKRSVTTLSEEKISITEIITDRHLQIQKWIRENLQATKHRYDVWHIAKGLKKKLLALAKEKDCDVVYKWVKSITNHLYWAASSTEDGDGEMVLSKWKSVANHVQNFHDGHDGKFAACLHDTLADRDRDWLKAGTKACTKLEGLVLNKRLCGDVRKMSTGHQTSTLEAFHSIINHFAPKMNVFSFHGMLCRQLLAAMHFNENILRPTATTKDGQPRVKTVFPKFKTDGDFTVKPIRDSPTYRYVDELLDTTVKICDCSIITPALTTPTPPPLTSGKRKPTKEEAIAVVGTRYNLYKKSKRVLEDNF